MKLTTRIFAAVLALASFGNADVSPSPSLAPEDIGAFKWIVGATGGEGEVVILRHSRTRTNEGKEHKEIHDMVSYSPGKRHEGSFVAINPNYFNVDSIEEPNWHIAAFGGSGWCPGKYDGSESGDNYGMIRFRDKSGTIIKYEFTAIVMSYEEAKKHYADFPDKDSTGWKWGGTPIQAAP